MAKEAETLQNHLAPVELSLENAHGQWGMRRAERYDDAEKRPSRRSSGTSGLKTARLND